MNIIDWNPADGDLCQGDVVIFRIPDSVMIDGAKEIRPRDNRLVLAEGEVTGHAHAIWFPQPAMFRDDGLARELEAAPPVLRARDAKTGTARLYRDATAIRERIPARRAPRCADAA